MYAFKSKSEKLKPSVCEKESVYKIPPSEIDTIKSVEIKKKNLPNRPKISSIFTKDLSNSKTFHDYIKLHDHSNKYNLYPTTLLKADEY